MGSRCLHECFRTSPRHNGSHSTPGTALLRHVPEEPERDPVYPNSAILPAMRPPAQSKLRQSKRAGESVKAVTVLNLGAGVQSTTLYLMAVRDALPQMEIDAAIFADTQDEPEEVYKHLDWLKSLNGPPILTGTAGRLGDDVRNGRNSTGGRFASIPAFTTDGVKIGITRRQCTKEYKLEVIGKVLRREILGLKPGAHVSRDVEVTQLIGISLDEAGRAGRLDRRPPAKYIRRRYPLIEKFFTRNDCLKWLQKFGQVPHQVPRSACVFCPYHSDLEWMRVKSNPADWLRAVEIDEALRTTGAVANRNLAQSMYLHRSCQPLVQIQFNPSPDPRAAQTNINYAAECMGVCGL